VQFKIILSLQSDQNSRTFKYGDDILRFFHILRAHQNSSDDVMPAESRDVGCVISAMPLPMQRVLGVPEPLSDAERASVVSL
jgi:hypothetical protein